MSEMYDAPESPRYLHTATTLADGRVLLAGGTTGDTFASTAAEIFDPQTDTFTPTGSLETIWSIPRSISRSSNTRASGSWSPARSASPGASHCEATRR